MRTIRKKTFVILDGILLPIDRITADTPGQQAFNRPHAKIRPLAEKAVATLKSRRLLRRLQCSTTRTTKLSRPSSLCIRPAQDEDGKGSSSRTRSTIS